MTLVKATVMTGRGIAAVGLCGRGQRLNSKPNKEKVGVYRQVTGSGRSAGGKSAKGNLRYKGILAKWT